ncbi:MAG: DUF4145 domain-containing protein [Ignavibacteriaceae bacterium]
MNRFDKVTFNDTKDKEYCLACSDCTGQTNHKVLTSIETVSDDHEGIQYWEMFEIVQCQGCKTISFRQNNQCSEDYVFDREGEMELENHVQLFPGRVAGRHKLKNCGYLDDPIEKIYDETHSALCNNLSILTGIGIRALIEVVCKDKKAKGRDLEKKIDDLVKNGILTNDGADILHSLRIMGNKAAHEVAPASQEVLDIAFDVVEHLLEGVYLLPLKAKKLPKRNIVSPKI